jgi:phosphatidate cytidylyltransferase
LKQRIVTGVLGGAGFLALLVWGSYAYAGFLLLLAVIGMYEYNRMNGANPTGISAGIALIGMILLVFPWSEWTNWTPNWEAIVWVTLFALFAITVFSKNKIQLDHVALLLTGMVYIGTGFHYLLFSRLSVYCLFC